MNVTEQSGKWDFNCKWSIPQSISYIHIYITYTPLFPFPVLTWARPSCYFPCHLGSQQMCTTGGVCPHSTKILPEFPLNGFSLIPTPNRLSHPDFTLSQNLTSHQNQVWLQIFIHSFLTFSFWVSWGQSLCPHLPFVPLCPQCLVCCRHAQVSSRCSAGVLGRGFSHHMSGGTRWSSECLPLPSWTILKPYQKGQLASSLLFSSLVKNKYEPFLQGLIIF